MSKAALRQVYLQKRLALSEHEASRLSEQLTSQFFDTVNLAEVHVLHTFLPIARKREPDTLLIIDRIFREHPAIRIAVPRMKEEDGSLDNFYYDGAAQLAQNKWGISEPLHGVPTPSEAIDMVLVPMLVFDESGHRVGYGKGYYDRFLSRCRKDCKKVGLSFFPPVESISAGEEHDQKMDQVVTPSRSYLF